MTLAIAIKYPFGKFARALENLSKIRPVQYQHAVLFISDSRWTYPDHSYEDDGMKLHDIDASTVVAFSGKVNIAEHCIENLRRKINDPRIRVVNVNETLMRTFRFHKNQNDNNGIKTGKLSFLLGKYQKIGRTELVLLESPDFKHKFIVGLEGIGDKEAYQEVEKVVSPKLEEINYTGREGDYITIAANIIDAVRVLVIENPFYRTVGGLLQFWVLDSRGITEYPLKYTHDPTQKAEWRRATIKRNELRTIKDKLNLGPDYLVK